MVVYASDSFNRADSATLGNANTGQPWNATDWGIASNMARKGAGGSNNIWLAAGAIDDHYIEINVELGGYVGGNQLFGTVSRYAGESDFLLWERVLVPASEDAVKLYACIGGVFTQRAIFGGAPGSTGLVPTDPLSLQVDHVGTLIVCWVNGSTVASYELSPVEDAALGINAGIRNEGVLTATFDSFIVESIGTPSDVPARDTAIHHSGRAIRFPYVGRY